MKYCLLLSTSTLSDLLYLRAIVQENVCIMVISIL